MPERAESEGARLVPNGTEFVCISAPTSHRGPVVFTTDDLPTEDGDADA